MNNKTTRFLGFFVGMAAAVGLDQWTKSLAVTNLMNQPPVELIPGVFEFLYSENRGAAFGMLQGKQIFFLVIAVAVMAAAVYTVYKAPATKHYTPLIICVTLIASGAIGNMIDRQVQGYVVDFLYFKLINFPIFNVADIYVTVATALLVALSFFFYKEQDFDFLQSGKKGE